MDIPKKSVDYNQSGARERSVSMLAGAVARLVNRCSCMDAEMRLRFMARLLENLADDEQALESSAPFSLQAVIVENADEPEKAVSLAAELLARNLRHDQGFSGPWLYRFYDALFDLLLPGQRAVQAA